MSRRAEVSVLHHVAILYHPRRKKAVTEAEWLGVALREYGVRARLGNAWNPGAVKELATDVQLAVALGGDGTIIQVARLIAPCAVPLLGVNLGRVGFLAEMTPQQLHGCVGALAEGAFWIEHRTMLDVTLHGQQATEYFLSLNEVSVARGASHRAVRVHTRLDGQEFMTYAADGLLVATATGSTAYSLAAGGPILFPDDKNFMITPVAPHLHIARSVVLPADTHVTLSVEGDRPAWLSVDGSDDRPLTAQDVIEVRRSRVVAQFARLGPRRYFYAAIASRLR